MNHRAVLSVAASLLLAGVVLDCGSAGPDSQSNAVTRAALAAQTAQLTALIPPPGSPCPPDANTQAVVKQQAITAVDLTYADPARSRLIALLTRDGNLRACYLAGGVDAWKPGTSTVHTDDATVSARVGVWNRSAQASGGPIAEPHNVEDCTYQLVKRQGVWLVSDYRCQFVNGMGP